MIFISQEKIIDIINNIAPVRCLNVYFSFVSKIIIRVLLPLDVLVLAHSGQSSHPRLVEEGHLVQVPVSDHP